MISSTEDEAAIFLEEGRGHRQSTSSIDSLEYATRVTGSPGTETVNPPPASAAVQEPPDIGIEESIRIGAHLSGGGTPNEKPQHEGLGAPDSKFTVDWKVCNLITLVVGSRGHEKKDAAQEAEPNARIWQVYNEQSEIFDNDMISDANSNLDILLIFVRI